MVLALRAERTDPVDLRHGRRHPAAARRPDRRAVGRDGGRLTPASLADTRRLLALARIDYVTLFLVIAIMVIKPTGDDTGVLIGMAAIWVLGLAYSISRHQAVG